MAKAPKMDLSKFTGVMEAAAAKADAIIDVALIDIEKQVRTQFGDLEQFAEGIKANGLDTPITVLSKPDGRYRLIAGERRVRAFRLLGLAEIPARIKRGDMTPFEIRGMQVRENNDRENLSAYDEAMGVAEDVETFGFKEAMAIWNRSEAWVSKRTAVKKYAAPVLDVLNAGLCGDLEVLHSLNQLHGLSVKEYGALIERMRSGVTVGRDEARNKVSSVKVWKKQSEEAEKALRQRAKAAKTTDQAPSDDGDDGASVPQPTLTQKGGSKPAKKVAKPDPKGKQVQAAQVPMEPTAEQQEELAAAARRRASEQLHEQRAALMDGGSGLRSHLNRIQESMLAAGFEPTEAEWVLWNGFLDTVLPMFVSLGKPRALAYLKRLQIDLKNKDALEQWRELHPAAPGQDQDSDDSEREPVARMPDGWTF